jgi:hypothetical protein
VASSGLIGRTKYRKARQWLLFIVDATACVQRTPTFSGKASARAADGRTSERTAAERAEAERADGGRASGRRPSERATDGRASGKRRAGSGEREAGSGRADERTSGATLCSERPGKVTLRKFEAKLSDSIVSYDTM